MQLAEQNRMNTLQAYRVGERRRREDGSSHTSTKIRATTVIIIGLVLLNFLVLQ